jgi:transcriptional regulator with XRE-family HTH domain
MTEQGQLGEFLQTRRAQVHPDQIGLATYGERRRVPGLRREELAQLAGVSASYYTRLEQGVSLNASSEILDAIARALGLDAAETVHLHALADTGKRRTVVRRPPLERASAATGALLAALGQTPTIVTGRRSDVLAWNPMGHALFAGHLDPAAPARPKDRPNMARLVFLDAHTRELYADWPSKAKAVVGNLRLTVGQHSDDPLLAGLIGELTMKSAEFATMWADHRIQPCAIADYEMRHPVVGTLTLSQQTLQSPAEGQNIVVATASPGSPAQTALALLAQATTPATPASTTWPSADVKPAGRTR